MTKTVFLLKLFASYVILTWSLTLIYNFKCNANAKYMYYVESDASFIRYLNMYERPSLDVLKRIDEFVRQNNIEKPLFSSSSSLEVNESFTKKSIILRKRNKVKFQSILAAFYLEFSLFNLTKLEIHSQAHGLKF